MTEKLRGSDEAGGGERGGNSRLGHPNLFNYCVEEGTAVESYVVPPAYIDLGRACISENPLERPTFEEILRMLAGIKF